jgi:hypothetical protein
VRTITRRSLRTIHASVAGSRADDFFAQTKRERAEALPLVPVVAVDQSRSPALADIIGARRVRTAVMISSGSIPWR